MPGWAVELIRQVERLNEKIPNHVTWTERNVLDHEKRLRSLEQFRWTLVGISVASGGVSAIVSALLKGI
jgi:hypothetical protein